MGLGRQRVRQPAPLDERRLELPQLWPLSEHRHDAALDHRHQFDHLHHRRRLRSRQRHRKRQRGHGVRRRAVRSNAGRRQLYRLRYHDCLLLKRTGRSALPAARHGRWSMLPFHRRLLAVHGTVAARCHGDGAMHSVFLRLVLAILAMAAFTAAAQASGLRVEPGLARTERPGRREHVDAPQRRGFRRRGANPRVPLVASRNDRKPRSGHGCRGVARPSSHWLPAPPTPCGWCAQRKRRCAARKATVCSSTNYRMRDGCAPAASASCCGNRFRFSSAPPRSHSGRCRVVAACARRQIAHRRH